MEKRGARPQSFLQWIQKVAVVGTTTRRCYVEGSNYTHTSLLELIPFPRCRFGSAC